MGGRMVIEPVEDHLGDLKLVPLRALLPTRDPYNVLLLQPTGPIVGSAERVGNEDATRAEHVCRSFLQKAAQVPADLVVTPEYCLPWTLVQEIRATASKLRPSDGAIWVLGCESITPMELAAAVVKIREAGNFVYHETLDTAETASKVYVDPLVYVLWCTDAAGSRVLSLIVQFKTEASRDLLDVEVRSLCLGNVVYSFNRGINKIALISIICSDAFAFNEQLINDYHPNCLLIHIQLNQKPAHHDYAAYRTQLCKVGSRSNVELLCLNWAGAILERIGNGELKNWQNNSGSAWYVPPAKFNALETHIVDAHRFGLYYSLVADRWHTFFLNSEPHALLLQKQKVLVHDCSQALMPAFCVTVAGRWVWNTSDDLWADKMSADDCFGTVLATYHALPVQLTSLANISPIAVERALELLSGPSTKPESWFRVDVLECMHVAAQESIRRITVNQEPDPNSPGVPYRRSRLQRAQDAITLPGHGVPWPPTLKDLEDGFSFQWSEGAPHYNVVAKNSDAPAALIYLADQSNEDLVDKAYTFASGAILPHALKMAIGNSADPMDAIARARDRLCVVYRMDHALKVWGPDRTSRIDRPPETSAVDIAGDSL